MTCALSPSPLFADAVFRQLRHVLFALTAVLSVAFSATGARAQCVGTIVTGDVTRCAGGNVTLTAIFPIPGGTISWRRNGVPVFDGVNVNGTTISGAATTTLTLGSIDPLDAGEYTVRYVYGIPFNCSGISPAVTVSVPSALAFTVQPSGSTFLCEGSNFSLTVANTGSPTSFQWKRNGVNLVNGVTASGTVISGANTASLSLGGTDSTDTGLYTCTISNTCSNLTSTAASLTVRDRPVFTTGPVNISACQGEVVNFNFTITGATPMVFQWRRNGVNLVNGVNADGTTVSGVNTPTLTLSSVATGDSGSYSCVATNGCDSVIGSGGSLTVAAAPTITTQPISRVVCPDSGTNFTVAASSPAGVALTYQWQRNGLNLTNGVNANGTLIGGATSPLLSLNSIAPGDAGIYACVVRNACPTDNTAISTAAVLTVTTAPSIISSPASRSACELGSTTFNVSIATGNPPATIRWQKDGVDLTDGARFSGVTTASLTITGLVPSDAGAYRAAVSNNCVPVFSTPASLTVNPQISIITQPFSPPVCVASNVIISVVASGFGPITYQWQKGGVNLTNGVNANGTTVTGANAATLLLSSVARGDAGTYTCVITSPCETETTNTVSLIVQDVQITSTLVNRTTCVGDPVTFSISATGTPAPTYQWQRNNVNLVNGLNANGTIIAGATGPSLTLTNVALAEAGTFRCIVSNACDSATSNPATLTVNTFPTVTPVQNLNTCENETVSLAVTVGGTPTPTVLWRRNGVPLVNGVTVNGTVISGATTPVLTLSNAAVADSGTYVAVVANSCNALTSGGGIINIRPATTITSQPVSRTVCSTANADFSVVAGGTGPFTYQWRRNGNPLINGLTPNGTLLTGTNSATLSVLGVGNDSAGAYSCVVAGPCGTVTSNTADLVVSQPVSIFSQPASTTQCVGSTVTLAVGTTGTPAPTYRWRRGTLFLIDGTTPGGTVISGATTATLVLTGVTAADAGAYDCVVSNACGPVVSSAASVTVTAGTAITAQPQPVATPVGTSASFTVATNGGTPISYQWQRNGVNLTNGTLPSGTTITGTTTPSLSLSAVTDAVAGNYRCVITTLCGALNTSTAALVPFTDLGTASDNTLTHTAPLIARGIIWVRFTTTQDAVDPDRFLDLTTLGSVLSSGNIQDTEIGLYTSTGILLDANDDIGTTPGFSRLSYGQTSPDRPYPPLTVDAAGQDGLLPAGTYYLAAGAWSMAFGSTGFDVAATSAKTGTIVINIIAGTAVAPCVSDLNTDGTIDGSDFIDFINSFGIGDAAIDPLADIVDAGGTTPGDGTIDGSDFIAFINAFAAGC